MKQKDHNQTSSECSVISNNQIGKDINNIRKKSQTKISDKHKFINFQKSTCKWNAYMHQKIIYHNLELISF